MVLEFNYIGGVEQFRLHLPNHSYLEDNHLASARFLRINEIDQFLILVEEQGLHYDKEQNYSNDFTVMSWIGLWWQADWLHIEVYRCFMRG
ncbi:hypothetical protein SAMN05421813_11760 [Daejeonella rubra]|uniref:Uncharacterized protein n=1 Tax=Daejeonella rubra TaxID=990371 RepID=A0A1G9USL1_9SPHI|nr:hypothetical protein SAMN05421813_11760 [Daejeonella rubra]